MSHNDLRGEVEMATSPSVGLEHQGKVSC